MASNRRVIVGTAGHIDHGKTRLVEAITGIDCDRWDEERRRGITIDIGFAHLEREDLQLGFIDVPGHERFLHNALAGLGGIRVLLLVVAADEGVKPQTLEHLEICSLLGIERAVVALTKTDLVSADLLELARLEVEELLGDSPWPDAPLINTSATEGTGISELVDTLVSIARELPEEQRLDEPVRLPIDRAFQLRGLGSIVTGTLISGTVRRGASLEVLPGDRSRALRGKIRSLEVHGRERETALAGERTALQLSGISVSELARGQQLVDPESFATTTSLLVEANLVPTAPASLTGWTDVQIHVYASEILGKIRPLDRDEALAGETCVAEIRLAAPLVAVRGDRFVVRRLSPAATLGGGRILDPAWVRRRGPARRRAIEALSASTDGAIRFWVDAARLRGLDPTELAPRLGRRTSEAAADLGRVEADRGLLRVDTGVGRPPRWIDPRHFADLESRATALLGRYFEERPRAAGIPRAEAVRRLMPTVTPELAKLYLEWLAKRGVLVESGELLNLPGREASLTGEESALAERLEASYVEAGLQPPSPAEMAGRLGAKPQIVDGVAHYLVDQGRLTRLGGGLIISSRALERTRADLLASGLDDFTVAQFKDRFGLSRKWAIPILEYFDSRRITHRLGNIRKVSRKDSR